MPYQFYTRYEFHNGYMWIYINVSTGTTPPDLYDTGVRCCNETIQGFDGLVIDLRLQRNSTWTFEGRKINDSFVVRNSNFYLPPLTQYPALRLLYTCRKDTPDPVPEYGSDYTLTQQELDDILKLANQAWSNIRAP